MNFESRQQLDTTADSKKKNESSPWVRKLILAGGIAAQMFSADGANNNEAEEASPADKSVTVEKFIGKSQENFTLQDIIETQVMFNQMPYEQVIYSLIDKALDSEDPLTSFAEVQKEIEQQTKSSARFVDYEIVTQLVSDHYSAIALYQPEKKAEYYNTMKSLVEGMSESSESLIEDFWQAHTSPEEKETFQELRNDYWNLLDERYVAFQDVEKSQGLPNAYLLNPKLAKNEQYLKSSEKQKEKLENQLGKILSEDQQKILVALEQATSDLDQAKTLFSGNKDSFLAQQ